jgi:hypothetical protein
MSRTWELLAVDLSLSLSPQALDQLYPHPLFGPLPVIITSNVECQLFPQPRPTKMKDYSNAITWGNQNNSFSFTGPCGDHSIMYNFTGPIQCWVVQIKLEQFLPVLIPVAHIYGTMNQGFRSGPSEKTNSRSRSSSPKTKILVLV